MKKNQVSENIFWLCRTTNYMTLKNMSDIEEKLGY